MRRSATAVPSTEFERKIKMAALAWLNTGVVEAVMMQNQIDSRSWTAWEAAWRMRLVPAH